MTVKQVVQVDIQMFSHTLKQSGKRFLPHPLEMLVALSVGVILCLNGASHSKPLLRSLTPGGRAARQPSSSITRVRVPILKLELIPWSTSGTPTFHKVVSPDKEIPSDERFDLSVKNKGLYRAIG